ncbi:MAG: class I SAM-dependent methyltransferase [Candidatus Pacebacteria bacterium]|nr:class I SAM-dependent methyltransferase [Candidatus Paceibacterota bacterium]
MDKNTAQKLLDKVRDDYNQISEDFSNTRVQIWPETAILFDYIKKGDRVLDLGCGNGRFVNIIKEKGGEYFGTDVSEKLIETAKRLHPNGNFQTTEPLKLPFSEGYFDIIYLIAVFHHIPLKGFRLEFLKEAKRVLKPGGFLILTVWKPKDKQEKLLGLKFLFKKIFGLPPHHNFVWCGGESGGLDFGDVIEPWFGRNKGERYFHCFTKNELTKLVLKVGLEIKESGIIKNERGNRNNIYFVAKRLSS